MTKVYSIGILYMERDSVQHYKTWKILINKQSTLLVDITSSSPAVKVHTVHTVQYTLPDQHHVFLSDRAIPAVRAASPLLILLI